MLFRIRARFPIPHPRRTAASFHARISALRRAIPLIALALAVVPRLAPADPPPPDAAKLNLRIVKNSKEEFRAHGTWASIDNSVPPDNFDFPAIHVAGQYWEFDVGEKIKDWNCIAKCATPNPEYGAHETVLQIKGTHLQGPHDVGAKHDVDPNNLPLVTSLPFKWNIKFGSAPVRMTAEGRRRHSVSSGNPHTDLYGVRHVATAVKGPPNMVSGTAEVSGKHVEEWADSDPDHPDKNPPHLSWGVCLGGSPSDGSRVSYDAATHTLTIHVGAISFLNANGILGPGIDPRYADDPILNASIGDMVLTYLGVGIEGDYLFGGARTSLVDPEGELAFDGCFSRYQINNTALNGTIDSYANYDSLITADAGECASKLLDDFGVVDVMGDTIPSAEWREVLGVGLAFVTPQNLASLTSGFTVSALNVPAIVGISAAKRPPVVTAVETDSPPSIAASRSYPNPFTVRTTIHYRVTQTSPVRIEVFDAGGRAIRRLVDESAQPSGDYAVTWDGTTNAGRRLSPGLYLYRVSIGAHTSTRTIALVK